MIQVFPIIGKAVNLRIRRRKWRNKIAKSLGINCHYSFTVEGSKLTVELSDLLIDTVRDLKRYDK